MEHNSTTTDQALTEDRASSEVIGMPVHSINEGLYLGQVRSILLDAKTRLVQGFLVERRKFSRDDRILPFHSVTSFGTDTLTVTSASAMERKGLSHEYARALRHPMPLIGAKVFSSGGHTLGKVDEYHFSVTDGKICGLEISADGFFGERSLIDGKFIIAISPNTIMIKEEAINTAISISPALLNPVESVKETANSIKNGAKEATKKLTSSLSGIMEKYLAEPSSDPTSDDSSELMAPAGQEQLDANEMDKTNVIKRNGNNADHFYETESIEIEETETQG